MNLSYYYKLRKVYYTILTGKMYDSAPLDVYDYVAADTADPFTRPYVIIGDMDSQDRDDKCDRTENCTVTIQVVSAFSGQGGRTIADEVADLILNSKSSFNTSFDGIQILGMKKTSDLTLFEQSPTGKYFRRIMIFSHIINEA